MSDLFLKKDIRKLLEGKSVLFLGDSNIRALYKDFVCLFVQNKIIANHFLKAKGEDSFMGDTVIGGSVELHAGRDFHEHRHFHCNNTTIQFLFLNRVYNQRLRCLLDKMQKEQKFPDLIIMNSTLWDISRWGPNGPTTFKDNLIKLMVHLKRILHTDTKFLWLTGMPISSAITGSILVDKIEFLKNTLRYEMFEANYLARKIVVQHGFLFLDTHYYLKLHIHRWHIDGFHWTPVGMRHVTNLVLTHICLLWKQTLPGNFKSPMLSQLIDKAKNPEDTSVRGTTVVFPSYVPNDPQNLIITKSTSGKISPELETTRKENDENPGGESSRSEETEVDELKCIHPRYIEFLNKSHAGEISNTEESEDDDSQFKCPNQQGLVPRRRRQSTVRERRNNNRIPIWEDRGMSTTPWQQQEQHMWPYPRRILPPSFGRRYDPYDVFYPPPQTTMYQHRQIQPLTDSFLPREQFTDYPRQQLTDYNSQQMPDYNYPLNNDFNVSRNLPLYSNYDDQRLILNQPYQERNAPMGRVYSRNQNKSQYQRNFFDDY